MKLSSKYFKKFMHLLGIDTLICMWAIGRDAIFQKEVFFFDIVVSSNLIMDLHYFFLFICTKMIYWHVELFLLLQFHIFLLYRVKQIAHIKMIFTFVDNLIDNMISNHKPYQLAIKMQNFARWNIIGVWCWYSFYIWFETV